METQLGNNDNETTSRRLGGIFLIIGWLLAIWLVGYLIQHSLYATKIATITTTAAGTQITLTRDHDSHFRIKGSINGIPVTFLIDTGATSIAVSAQVADHANLIKKTMLSTQTANGTGTGYFTIIDKLMIGDIEFNNLSATIIPAMGNDDALLGMNVLSKFKLEQTGDTMTLTVPTDDRAGMR